MDEYKFPKFGKSSEIPEPANKNERIDSKALLKLRDIDDLIKKTQSKVNDHMTLFRDRSNMAEQDQDTAGYLLMEEQIRSLQALQDACLKVEERRRVLLDEPDSETLRDAEALHSQFESIVKEYEQILGD